MATYRNVSVMIPLDPGCAGIAMAQASDEEQAAFVDAFVRELHELSRTKEGVRHQLDCAKWLFDPWTKMVLGMTDST